MRTFWAVRHMARVEWVTVQVRWSQSRGGLVKVVAVDVDGGGGGGEEEEEDGAEGGAYLEGMRRLMSLEAMVGL